MNKLPNNDFTDKFTLNVVEMFNIVEGNFDTSAGFIWTESMISSYFTQNISQW